MGTWITCRELRSADFIAIYCDRICVEAGLTNCVLTHRSLLYNEQLPYIKVFIRYDGCEIK